MLSTFVPTLVLSSFALTALPAYRTVQIGAYNPAPLASSESGSCQPSWLSTFGAKPGFDRHVFSLAGFDDGTGPALYAGGAFITAGGVRLCCVAKWDGAGWSGVGGGIVGTVLSLMVFDDQSGSGSALYAGGSIVGAGGQPVKNVVKWDGSNWSPLGNGLTSSSLFASVRALAAFDDGNGPALYAGGNFTTSGTVTTDRIAKWDGTAWSALGSGMGGGFSPDVYSLAVFDDGNESSLYAGGIFTTAGGVVVNHIARWDGTGWSALGSGVDAGGGVSALTVFDDGGGAALYAGGGFTTAGGVAANNIAKWDGAAWSPLGSGLNGGVVSLAVFDDGSGGGPSLYAGGSFNTGVVSIAKWNGASWSQPGNGMYGGVFSLTVFDDGSGPASLYAGGSFTTAGGLTADRIARWDGTSWSPLGRGMGAAVEALEVFDDGSGPALYAGGAFPSAADTAVNFIARRDGASWSPLGSGVGAASFFAKVKALEVFDDGSGGGPALFAGGRFTTAGNQTANHIAKWDGGTWSPLGSGVGGTSVNALAVFDDGNGGGPALYAAGHFTTAGGLPATRSIARWDGTSWSQLGTGLNDTVHALAVYDSGSGGPALYAGGSFTSAGGIAASRIAKWDGTSWSPLGNGIAGNVLLKVLALAVFDDGSGSGPELYVGGRFTTAGNIAAERIAKWNGSNWSAVGSGVNGPVEALTVFDDGNGGGPALYAGGGFRTAGGVPASKIAKWDGLSWSRLGNGLTTHKRRGQHVGNDADVLALTVFDDGGGGGPALFAGGRFMRAIDSGDSYLAKWGGCNSQGGPVVYCSGKTTSALCVPFLTFSGVPSASSGVFTLFSSNHIEGQPGLYLYSFNQANTNFHAGKLCVKAPLHRLSTLIHAADGTGCTGCAGNCRTFKRNFNELIQSGTDPMLIPGQIVHVQVRQNDPANLAPTGFADNLSNAISFVIGP